MLQPSNSIVFIVIEILAVVLHLKWRTLQSAYLITHDTQQLKCAPKKIHTAKLTVIYLDHQTINLKELPLI